MPSEVISLCPLFSPTPVSLDKDSAFISFRELNCSVDHAYQQWIKTQFAGCVSLQNTQSFAISTWLFSGYKMLAREQRVRRQVSMFSNTRSLSFKSAPETQRASVSHTFLLILSMSCRH